jgi:hypothetical protein
MRPTHSFIIALRDKKKQYSLFVQSVHRSERNCTLRHTTNIDEAKLYPTREAAEVVLDYLQELNLNGKVERITLTSEEVH